MQPNEKMDELIETKLTKTEAIDLLVEEMRTELEAERADVDRQMKALSASITLKDLSPGLTDIRVDINVPGKYRSDYHVGIAGDVKLSRFSAHVQSKLSRLKELTERQEELGKRHHELSESKARIRTVILKSLLEGSEQGQKFLELLDSLRLKVSPKLLQLRKALSA